MKQRRFVASLMSNKYEWPELSWGIIDTASGDILAFTPEMPNAQARARELADILEETPGKRHGFYWSAIWQGDITAAPPPMPWEGA